MRNLLILCITTVMIMTSSLSANVINESKTDIYYGNGVWNLQFTKTKCKKQDAAECSQRYLDRLFRKEIIKNDSKLQARYGKVKLAYNQTKGKFADLLETFYQLKEAGQISERTFFATVDELMAKSLAEMNDGIELEEMRQIVIDAIVETEQENVDTMQKKYYNESFKHSHRVLLVSHSQGNMFANRIYDTINPTGYKNYFANMQVASPASSIHAPKGKYVTGFFDPAINPIPGSMEYNAVLAPAGHAFVGTYLDTLDPRTKIVDGIKKLLLQLDAIEKTPSQWETKSEISEKGTKEYRITVKHIFDDGVLDIDDEVYPFNTKDGKIYQVPDTIGTLHYAKASFGGEKILSADDVNEWEAEDNQFYKLEGTDPVEYIEAIATIASYFDNDDEGWTISGDAQAGSITPIYKNGYIQAIDDTSGYFWYFNAPQKFSGDLFNYYNTSFSYELTQNRTSSPAKDIAMDIIIDSEYQTIGYRFNYSPNTSWTLFAINMTELGWKDEDGNQVTSDLFKEILKSVTKIRIRGEYRYGPDIGSLDNVILGNK